MAIAWVLRDQGERSVTSTLIGASSVAQLDDNLDAVNNLAFSDEELSLIDGISATVDGTSINIWGGATASRTRG